MTPESAPDSAPEQELVGLVLGYIRGIDAAHRKYAPLLRAAPEPKAVFDACRREMDQVRRQYLTQRKRNHDNGISTPPRFTGAEAPGTVFQVEADEKKGTVTVLTARSLDFRFSLRRQKGEWRISSMFQRYHSADRSVEYQWQRAEL